MNNNNRYDNDLMCISSADECMITGFDAKSPGSVHDLNITCESVSCQRFEDGKFNLRQFKTLKCDTGSLGMW